MPDWGKVCLITRLEKMVENQFVHVWTDLIMKGIRRTDAVLVVKDRVAHMAANDAVRAFLQSNCDSVFFLDSDADIGPTYLEELRELEDGWEFDIFQGFYVRRGWPPEAIWFKETELGDLMQCLVWKDNHTEPTAMVGLHNTLIRREVFEKMVEANPEVPLEDFNWFYYPRHGWQSEDGTFSWEARKLGFKVGSTTKIKAGHITRITTGWETYQEHLQLSGTLDMWANYYDLVERVADFTGETYDAVIAKSIRGGKNTKAGFESKERITPEDYRAFYGEQDSGYLYDLLAWNVSPFYHQIIKPLKEVRNKKVLIIGAGLGTEVEFMKDNNQVYIFELPGILRKFLIQRFEDDYAPFIWTESMLDNPYKLYFDLVVAIDVIEHFHPDEFEATMDAMLLALKPDGEFYLHNNFREAAIMPQAFDHSEAFNAWCTKNKIQQPETEYGFYRRDGYAEAVSSV